MYQRALTSLSILFFMVGFITCLNDILVPYLKKAFSLDYGEAALIQGSFFAAYGLLSIPASRLIEKMGYKIGMIIGFLMTAFGCLLFVPAGILNEYHWFLCALFVIAIGIVLLQVAANPYVSLIGPPETTSSRLTFVQAFFSLGTFIAPFFGAVLILGNGNNVTSLRLPYLIIAGVILGVAFMISRLSFPETNSVAEKTSWSSLLSSRKIIFGMIGIFLYVGAFRLTLTE